MFFAKLSQQSHAYITMLISGGLGIVSLFAFSNAAFAQQSSTPVLSADVEDVDAEVQQRFIFGSYGRIIAATDLEGGGGKDVNVTSYGPRLNETPYLELDLSYELELEETIVRTVTTLAVSNAIFHETGQFDSAVTLRNAYVEALNFGIDGFSAWAGSRMYRGDDIYLLDFWPMDNLNTNGAGIALNLPSETTIQLHGGMNRLATPYQYQEVTVAGPGFETEQEIFNDRVRSLASLRVQQLFLSEEGISAKVVLWLESQTLGAGQYRDENNIIWQLAEENGYAAGLEIGAWGFGENSFANLFFRYATGLSAYGELALPSGYSNQRTITDARLVRVGTSFNYENGPIGLMGGAYFQRFDDADSTTYDRDDYNEAVVAIRPLIFIGDHFRQGFEASYQVRRSDGLDPRTDTFLIPEMWKFAIIPSIALQPNSYSRPELRAIYSVSLLNDGAISLFPENDPRHLRDVQHFFGVGAEWWFNSSSYQ